MLLLGRILSGEKMRRMLNLFLIGPMGAGKSTIGRQLAKELNLDFYDTDQEIEDRTGADIGWIFDVEGEDGFRKREQAIIEELTEKSGIILATGGGVVLSAQNRNRLAARGTVVYLKTSIEQQKERTVKDKKRPLIQNITKERGLDDIMEYREPLYSEIADIVIMTDGRTVRSVANEIVKTLRED